MSKICFTFEIEENRIEDCVDFLQSDISEILAEQGVPTIDSIKILILEKLLKRLKEGIDN